jgi:uncharacterized protein (TIGR03663 family)
MSAPVKAAFPLSPLGRSGIFIAVVALAIIGGALVRWFDLGRRPVHTDEAVNAFQTARVLEGEGFRYDPKDYHGPLFIALNAFTACIAGGADLGSLTEQKLRFGAVLSSLLGLAIIFPYPRIAGGISAGFAAVCLAVDPIFVYYGRYAIHESLFISLTFGFLLAVQLACKTGSLRWWGTAGLMAGLMLSTKETAVIAFAATAAAGAVCLRRPSSILKGASVFLAAAIITTVFCYTWAFRNWSALVDLAAAGPGYLLRAGGQGHEKPAFYYAGLLLGTWSGPLHFGLALVGIIVAWRKKVGRENVLFLSVYTLLVCVIYSLIPYKTPWLALNLWLPLLLLAGCGFSWCLKRSTFLGSLVAVLVLATMAVDVRASVFRSGWDERNPLAYSHPTDDILELPVRVSRLATSIQRPLKIGVLAADPWPIPWYLRNERFVGYWPTNAPTPEVDVLILDGEAAERLQLDAQGCRCWIFSQRPGSLLFLYWRHENKAS